MRHPPRPSSPSWLCALLLALSAVLPTDAIAAAPLTASQLPPELRAWVPWALDGAADARCALVHDETDTGADAPRLCDWPAVLDLQIDAPPLVVIKVIPKLPGAATLAVGAAASPPATVASTATSPASPAAAGGATTAPIGTGAAAGIAPAAPATASPPPAGPTAPAAATTPPAGIAAAGTPPVASPAANATPTTAPSAPVLPPRPVTNARFTLAATLLADGWLALPGSLAQWPQDVLANGRPGVVLPRDEAPALWLPAGRYVVTGRWAWSAEPPQSLPTPPSIGLVRLVVGREAPVSAVRDSGGAVSLGRGAGGVGTEGDGGVPLRLTVFRKLEDGVPARLTTQLLIEAAGTPREVAVGPVLPAGFTALSLQSAGLPARLDEAGRLRLQTRPGVWTLELVAVAPREALARIALPAAAAPWPEEEIWAWQAAPELRTVELTGAAAVDTRQTRMPDAWKALPAYLLQRPAGALVLEERARGAPAAAPDALTLERTLWLDFAGGGYTARDAIAGTLGAGGWRLDSSGALLPGQVLVDGEPALITRTAEGRAGVELRRQQTALAADARFVRDGGALPATGYSRDFAQVRTELRLPPGWQLVAALGADTVDGDWLTAFSLLDLFLILIAVVASLRLLGFGGAALAAVTLALSWHEEGAVRWAWLHLLAVTALLAVLTPAQQATRLGEGLRRWWFLGLLVVVLPFFAFARGQLQAAIYPVLELPGQAVGPGVGASAVEAVDAMEDVADRRREADVVMAPAPIAAPAPPPPPPPPAEVAAGLAEEEASSAAGSAASRSYAEYAAGNLARAKILSQSQAGGQPSLSRLPAGVLTQTGPGLPVWQWRSAVLAWQGPVTPAQSWRAVLLPPWATRALRLLMLVTTAGWLLLLVRRRLAVPPPAAPRQPAAVPREAGPGTPPRPGSGSAGAGGGGGAPNVAVGREGLVAEAAGSRAAESRPAFASAAMETTAPMTTVPMSTPVSTPSTPASRSAPAAAAPPSTAAAAPARPRSKHPRLGMAIKAIVVAVVITVLVSFCGRVFAQAAEVAPPAPPNGFFAQTAASAGEQPSDERLAKLRQRLLRGPDCLPACASLLRLGVEARGDALTLRLVIAAQEAVALPLPLPRLLAGDQPAAWQPQSVTGPGGAPATLRRGADGGLLLLAVPGVQEVLVRGSLARLAQLELPLPVPPRAVFAPDDALQGWTLAGVDERGQAAGSLQLVRAATAAAGTDAPGTEAPALPPLLRVRRELRLGLDWEVETTVRRDGATAPPVLARIPLLPGERPVTDGLTVVGDEVFVSLAPEQAETRWTSRLARKAELVLTAARTPGVYEEWSVAASPLWNVVASGIPETMRLGENGEWQPRWHPWPGERLTLAITRPDGVPGPTFTVDGSALELTPGAHARELRLVFSVRASQGMAWSFAVPKGATLTRLQLDGADAPWQAQDGRIRLALHPGANRVEALLRQPAEWTLRLQTPAVEVQLPPAANGQPVPRGVNAELTIVLPADRWLLALGGPSLGPALLFWGVLLAWLAAAVLLGRQVKSPLKAWHWLLLALGLSQLPLALAAVVLAWIAALAWRGAQPVERWSRPAFNLVQVGLVLLTLVALSTLFGAVAKGLLGQPDMMVQGNQSDATHLAWYQDRHGPALPQAWVVTVSLWWFRALMLAWALWLALRLLDWLRWGWGQLGAGGLWRGAVVVAPVVSPAAGRDPT